MTRKEFIRICGILGIGLPHKFSLTSCRKDDEPSGSFKGKVIIIGAGAGGLSAGYLLQQKGIDIEILEASSCYGGRIKVNTSFADFPIPLGAEWIETTNPNVFQNMVNNPSVKVNVQTFEDAPDLKFLNYSWYNFFEEYIVPSISNKISYHSAVETIDYSGEGVVVNTKTKQHITQNWNNEPFIKAGYMTDYADWRMVREPGNTVANKIFFAGAEYTDGENWVSVHTAAESAKKVVEELMNK
jgi:hypothetical protein